MPRQKVAADPYKRFPTRHRGVSYRVKADGSRSYSVYFQGTYVPVEGGETEALAMQADLRAKKARGERVNVNDRTTFGELAESWYGAKQPRLRQRTADDYRAALDHVLLPRFGNHRLGAIDADAIAKLTRDLERVGLNAIDRKRPVRPLGHAAVLNYLKPLQGTLKLAARRRLIPSNPFDVLTADDRPQRAESAPAHEWTEDEVAALLAASRDLAAKPDARYDYSPILRLVAVLGLRLGEVLGLKWQDFDKDAGVLHIARQWTIHQEYGPPKTKAGTRRIALPSDLQSDLIALRLRSGYSTDDHPIFASRLGTPIGHRNLTRRGFEPARDLAKLPSSLTFHDLRHAAASRLIRAGLDVVTVANVLGHEDPTITLRIYSHMFNRETTDDLVRKALGGAASS